MATERIVERNDGVTAERTVERTPETVTTVERRGGGSGLLWALVALALIAIVGFFLLQMSRNEAVETEAVSSAASSVAGSVDNAADAVGDAARSVTPAAE